MNQRQYIQTLTHQIRLLNAKIDRKIMVGQSYKAEARQHRILIRKLNSHRNPGIFDRLFSPFNYA